MNITFFNPQLSFQANKPSQRRGDAAASRKAIETPKINFFKGQDDQLIKKAMGILSSREDSRQFLNEIACGKYKTTERKKLGNRIMKEPEFIEKLLDECVKEAGCNEEFTGDGYTVLKENKDILQTACVLNKLRNNFAQSIVADLAAGLTGIDGTILGQFPGVIAFLALPPLYRACCEISNARALHKENCEIKEKLKTSSGE